MTMLNERAVVDLIERAHTKQPYCECGRDTTTIYRDGTVWLDCSIVLEPIGGTIRRLWNALTAGVHVHRRIIDLYETDQLAA